MAWQILLRLCTAIDKSQLWFAKKVIKFVSNVQPISLNILAVAYFASNPTSLALDTPTCLHGYKRSSAHHCFKLITTKKTFAEAKDGCEKDVLEDPVWTSRLAEPRLASETNMLMQIIKGFWHTYFHICLAHAVASQEKFPGGYVRVCQGYVRLRRGSGGLALRTPENFRKCAKNFLRKLPKMHYFSLFFKKVEKIR